MPVFEFTFTYGMKWFGRKEIFMEIKNNKCYELIALYRLLLMLSIFIFCGEHLKFSILNR